MFSGISRRYDFLNHLLSLNRDRSWRRRTARELAIRKEDRILDACTGTGDLALELSQYVDQAVGGHVIGADFCPEMVAIGERKRRQREEERCSLVVADTLSLPWADETFDVVTVSFGIRNLCDLGAGLRELRRVLKPGGRIALLEFTPPRGAFLRSLFALYLLPLLPWIGRMFSRSSKGAEAYSYLPASVMEFPDPASLEELIREAGFDSVRHRLMTVGIVALHLGHRAEVPGASPATEEDTGNHALLLPPGSTPSTSAIAETLQEQLGMHRSDAIARARYGGGLLASGETRPRLEKLAEALQTFGVESSIARSGQLEDLPRPKRITGLELSSQGLTAFSPGGRKTALQRSSLAGLRAYALLPDEGQEEEENENPGPAHLQSPLVTTPEMAEEPALFKKKMAALVNNIQEPEFNGISFHLVLYSDSPLMALKINKDEFDYSCLGEDKTDNSLENYIILLAKLIDWLPASRGRKQAETFLQELNPREILLSGENEAACFDRSYLWNMKTRDGETSPGEPAEAEERPIHD